MTAKLKVIKFSAMAEHVAAGLLRLKGCRILARQLRSPLDEIDIFTRRGRTLAFIEVKARATRDQAIEAVNSPISAGGSNGRRLPIQPIIRNLPGLDLRFDLITIAFWQVPRHLPNAWQI